MTKWSGRILGFDYGVKRIGIATGNTLTKTAQALTTLNAIGAQPDWLRINNIIKEWKPTTLIIGLPLLLDGSEGTMSNKAREFGEQLKLQHGIPIAWVDERFTSNHANALLTENSNSHLTTKRKKHRDSLAAELILTTYFNDHYDKNQV